MLDQMLESNQMSVQAKNRVLRVFWLAIENFIQTKLTSSSSSPQDDAALETLSVSSRRNLIILNNPVNI